MQFNSIEFLIFFVITYLLYRILSLRGQNFLLLLASYIFYGWLDLRLVCLIAVSTAITFFCGEMIEAGELPHSNRFLTRLTNQFSQLAASEDNRWRKRFLWFGVGANLAILGFFKYFNFFIDSVQALAQAVGFRIELVHLNLVLIAGVSFYTFKAISYIVDVYQQKVVASHNLLNFALYLAFFPSLLAGPIDRASGLLPQIENPRSLSYEQSAQGIFLILLGLFKKVAIADGIASSVNGIYDMAAVPSWLDVVLATLLYTIQIYCDFSGYSDIAIGLSKLFGIELMVNFNLPYFSRNPSEFWRRWHISLSTWLRDYLYIPLGGNRHGNLATYRNLMTTMVLGGLWHGAAWNYVLWGFYQGAILCIYRIFNPQKKQQPIKHKRSNLLWGVLATIFFFGVTCYGWLLFRANSLEQIVTFTQILLTDFGNFKLVMPKLELSASWGIPVLFIYEVINYTAGKSNAIYRFPTPARAAFYAILIFILILGASNAPAQYIYTQF